ncbi:MAG: dipeptidase [Verrucomicrobiota bacterium]
MKLVTDQQLNEFIEFLKYGSVSTDSSYKEEVIKCANWLVKKLADMGLKTEKHETQGSPIVLAKNEHRAERPTVLIYGHYDVQPVDPIELWEHPPFEPYIKDSVIYARGSTDNKGQILSHIFGIEQTLKDQGELPVNLIFLIEGEEEIGSPHLIPFLEQKKDELQCDVIVVSDTGMIAKGVPTFTYGLRGVAGMEVRLQAAGHDLHSGTYGGAIANPVTVLARLVHTLHDENMHVAIDGFYDDVKKPQSWEHEAWNKLPTQDEDWLHETGAPALEGESGYSTLERLWSRPTAEVNGLYGGYQGEGTKTVLPAEATLKLTFRTVPDQKCQDLLDKAEKHFIKHCPKSVRIEIDKGHSGEGYLCDPQSRYGKAAQAALKEAFHGTEPALIREGGSIPIIVEFKRVLGVDTLLLGLALPDCRAHSPNENFHLENMAAGIRLNRLLLDKIAKNKL